MKHYSLAHETETHYILHDKRDSKMFHIAKKGIDKDLHDIIKNMPAMNSDKPGDKDMPDNRDIPGTDSRPVKKQPQKFMQGGDVEPEEDSDPEPEDVPEPTGLMEQTIGYDQGGQIQPVDPDKAKQAQDSMRKAFKFDEGGPVPEEAPINVTASKLESQYAPEEQVAQQSTPVVPDPSVPPEASPTAPVQNQSVPEQQRAPASEASQPSTPYYLAKPDGAATPPQAEVPQEAPAKKELAHAAVKHEEQQSNLDQQLQENQARYEQLVSKQQEDDKRFSQLVATSKVDPNRFVNNQNLMQKITMGLGIALGGVGAGATHTSNDALEVVNQAINRDIDAQKNDQSNKMNLWKMNHESTKDQQAATLQTRNQLLETAKVKMDELMGTAPGPMALQRAAALKTQIQAEQVQNNMTIAMAKMKQQILSGVNNPSQPGKLSEQDPATLVPWLVTDPADRKTAFQEIKDAQVIRKNGPKILEAFDQAVKDKSLASGKFNPASVVALHQLMLPLFENIDGTVRQAPMEESFKNFTPSLTDVSIDNGARRKALVDWITSRSSAPVSRGHGIDLSRFTSTSHDIGGKIFTQYGAKWQMQPDGTAKQIK